jgi:predicted O-linked N-acetylglucosamine transferase (SPINDLY family)
MNAEELLEDATAQHRAGRFAEAHSLYQAILETTPEHPVALFRSGLLALQTGHAEVALSLTTRAASIAPKDPRYQLGRGQVLEALERLPEAAAAYQQALSLDPSSGDACFALALCQERLGQHAAAELAYRHTLELVPDHVGALARSGVAALAAGRLEQAVDLLGAAVRLEPGVNAHRLNLGIALCRGKDFAAARSVLEAALERDPLQPELRFNLGIALHGLGLRREALAAYRSAAGSRPGYSDAFNNSANVHKELGEFELAAAAYESAMGADPASVAARNNFGCLQRTLGRLDAAESLLRGAIALDPGQAALHDNLGNVLKDRGDVDGAIDSFRRSLELEPCSAPTHSNLAYTLNFVDSDPERTLAECRRWAQRFAAPLRTAQRPHDNERSAERRLRIGYVSADFREHCQSSFTIPLLQQHDHAGFEVHCYSSVERADGTTRRIEALADVWHDARHLTDAALAAQIRADRIDVLLDLTMHMAGGRPLVFARKPAPVQIAWLAYPGTTGIEAIDYRISDPRLDPPDAERWYSERTLLLPDSFWCYDPLTDAPHVHRPPALERGYVRFGCLNNPCKLSDATLLLWAPVVAAVPDSRLLLLVPPGSARQELSVRLSAAGIAPERVDFAPFRPRGEYLRGYHDIDVALDTVPYNGHTTTLDALWMGVPVVSRIGATCVGRGGLSQLHCLGLAELAVDTDAAFVATAVALATDLPRLTALRANLRARLEASALMDADRFARNIESLYRRAWRHYLAAGTI